MQNAFYNEVRNWIYRNGRHVELCLWQYYFEKGTKEAVADALIFYQNEDGGFGKALEPDNWNPNSTPVATCFALSILQKIDFNDTSHPIFTRVWKYLRSGKDMGELGWRFTVEITNAYPHAPWWSYNSKETEMDCIGITAGIAAFILKYGDRKSKLWKQARGFADRAISVFLSDIKYRGDVAEIFSYTNRHHE